VRRQDTADLAQEVFLVMWRRWAEFDPQRGLRPWLAGIAFKVAHGHHRRFWRREIPSDPLDPPTDAPGPDDEAAHARARELVLGALARLPEMYRSVLVMHDLDGLPVRDIAALVGLPRFTLHTRLRRARAHFEKLIRTLEVEPRPGRKTGVAALSAAALLLLERRSTAAPADGAGAPPASAVPWPRWAWLGLAAAALSGLVLVARRPLAVPQPSRSAPARASLPRAAAVRALRALPAPAPALAATPTAPDLDTGLAGHWSFDDGAGAIARDRSGRGNHCLLREREASQAWGPGRIGGAIDLGTKGWLECPQPPLTAQGPTALTVALWLKRQRPHTASTIVDRHLGPGPETVFHFALRGDTLQLWSGRWSHTTVHQLEAPPEGWVHLAFTHAGRTTKVFLDGVLVVQRDDTRLKSPGTTTAAPLIVGALVKDPTQPWQHFDGQIDELRLYERALTNEEVAALAAAGR
jgi:RNA polymerase sigma-70 factor (ECF subfamily)